MKNKAKFNFITQLDFSNQHLVFKDCPYYPCHKLPERQNALNCFFCFCPFYPCGGKLGSGRWIKNKGEKCFDCSECNFIHRNEVVSRIIELFYEGKNLKKIKRNIKRFFKR